MRDLVSIPSPSGEEGQVAAYIHDFLKANGVDAERDGCGNIVAVAGSGEEILHINGHMDTVCPVDTWTSDPFKPVVKDGLLYGLGASDMKSGLVVMMDLARKVRPRAKTVFSFTVCEEGSGAGGRNNGVATLLDEWGGKWAITAEGSAVDGIITLGLGTQGHTIAVVTVKGVSAHSSQPEMGQNAIEFAAAIVRRVRALNDSYDEVPVFADVTGRPAISATMIRGGAASNIIPDSCELTLSRRLAPGEDRAKFERELRQLCAGLEVEVDIRGGDPAACVDVDGRLLEAAREAARKTLGVERYSISRGRTDLVLFARKGMDVLNIGPGMMGQAHVADEWCALADLPAASGLLEEIINTI
ncbi:MAG: M20 family metallopeptidase [Planctomycetes bacterium]|nr:M20 family metallopeptidase [Planctomycetota bacterium]